MDNYIFQAMNCEFCLQGLTSEQSQEIQGLFENMQALLSRFEANSDVCLLNNNPGTWQQVQPLTFAAIHDAYRAFEETGGLYNPFLGNVLSAIGYNKSFEQLTQSTAGFMPMKHGISSIARHPLQLDKPNLSVKLAKDAGIDLGGYAKGWSAQLAYQYLVSQGSKQGLIDAGGDIIGWGRDWEIDISDPFDNSKNIVSITTNGLCAIATSNIIYRRWCNPDRTIAHHIIDPRTLQAAKSDLVQVSILADNLAKAEQFTKCLLILGSDEGTAWLQEHCPELGYILVTDKGNLITKNKGC